MTELDNIINALNRLFTKTNTMNPAMLALIFSLVEEAIKVTPGLIDDLKLIFDNPSPVPADWEALRAKVLAKGYADYVRTSALPASNVVQLPATAAPVPPAAPAPAAQPVTLSTPVPPPPGAAPISNVTLPANVTIVNGTVDPGYTPGT